tara:strand:+ start:20816 stop:21253 length:438 start_codon:yes stop_codon:yes gene_type:complete
VYLEDLYSKEFMEDIGKKDLKEIITNLSPKLLSERFVFCSVSEDMFQNYVGAEPMAIIREKEGITLLITEMSAKNNKFKYIGPFMCISLEVHSSLYSIGLIALVSNKLSDSGISTNVVSGYYHDHLFIKVDQAQEALNVLKTIDI